jgi:hypothetical protein
MTVPALAALSLCLMAGYPRVSSATPTMPGNTSGSGVLAAHATTKLNSRMTSPIFHAAHGGVGEFSLSSGPCMGSGYERARGEAT